MRKTTLFLTPLALFGLAIGTAQAETCFRLTPFIDILRLRVCPESSGRIAEFSEHEAD
jgi:hypothetical protein